MRLRGAVFGCGMISEFHLRGWLRIPEVEIVALCNRTASRAEERRKQFVPSARVYSDVRIMLDREQLEFIDILTVPSLHREHCAIARAAGLHIICQKPLADTLQEAEALARDMEGYAKLFAVHENHRYRPWFQKAVAEDFGPIGLAHFEHLNGTAPNEAYKLESGQGIMLEYGSHLVDMMRSVLGEPRRVYARMHRLNPRVRGESLVHAAYEYPDVTAVVEVGWKNSGITQGAVILGGPNAEVCYQGTLTRGAEGRMRISRGGRTISDEAISPMNAYIESFYLLERECADVMLGRREAVVQTAAEHLKSLRCTFAAYDSAGSGKIVELT